MTSKPDCAWNLADLAAVPRNGVKVMSTFACGGGSSMGYKLAGCDVVAANDIDPEMAWHYRKNVDPPHYFLCPIRSLLDASLPPEVSDLDILDGSPPCSTFSMAGSREKAWGKKKHFREGQAEQVLSDLFFDYLDVVELLRPRVAIAENVKGMIVGNAKGYTKMVMQRFKQIGYVPQLFLLNAADCGVPQRRERVFFCAIRRDLARRSLNLCPKMPWVTAAQATADLQELTSQEMADNAPAASDLKWWRATLRGHSYSDVVSRREGRNSLFQHVRLNGNEPAPTLSANHTLFTHWDECRRLTFREWKRLGSFPDDYVAKDEKIGKYMVGMSVPPRMTQAVASAVIDQWLDGGSHGQARPAQRADDPEDRQGQPRQKAAQQKRAKAAKR
jgi:DNA (cytosine-5)-methyltransferase 1